MVEKLGPKTTVKLEARCTACDRLVDHYNVWLSPLNEESAVCWECQMREEKGFFTKRDFGRQSRRGYVPR